MLQRSFSSTRFIHWIGRLKEISIVGSIKAIWLIDDVLKIASIICITFGMTLEHCFTMVAQRVWNMGKLEQISTVKRTMSTKVLTFDRLDYAFDIHRIQVQWMRLLHAILASWVHTFRWQRTLLCIHCVDSNDAGISGVSTENSYEMPFAIDRLKLYHDQMYEWIGNLRMKGICRNCTHWNIKWMIIRVFFASKRKFGERRSGGMNNKIIAVISEFYAMRNVSYK